MSMNTTRIIASMACTSLMATAFASPRPATAAHRIGPASRRWASFLPFGSSVSAQEQPLASCTATLATTDHSASTIALALGAVALCFITVALAAYHEGRRRGQSDEHNDANSNETKVAPSSRGARRTDSDSSSSSSSSSRDASLSVDPIGTLHSVYRLCVGTPRQGMLAPHSRGVITFDETRVSRDAILELQHYSHVFVVFVFHLNSNGQVLNANNGNNNGGDVENGRKGNRPRKGRGQFTSKIAPPSLGGKKVGVFSTRTPHRPNPIGFSLCRLDGVVHEKKKKNRKNQNGAGGGTFSLLLSGLDIVDGTPVLDVKPYVPHYDCVGYTSSAAASTTIPTSATDASSSNDGTSTASAETNSTDSSRVPHWVDSGLQKRRNVTFLPAADRFLEDLCHPDKEQSASLKRIQFYGPHSPWKDSPDQSVGYLKQCILEVLGADVRSAWQTRKARGGKFQAERSRRLRVWKGDGNGKTANATTTDGADGAAANGSAENDGLCTQQIDNLLVQYTIEEPGSAPRDGGAAGGPAVDERSRGSGAEDVVAVHSISLIR